MDIQKTWERNMIRKGLFFLGKHGVRKTLARTFLELGSKLEQSELVRSRNDVVPGSDDGKGTAINTLAVVRENIRKIENPSILEIGSRAVTRESLRVMLGFDFLHQYTGLDIHPGPNVDVVGDVHELSSLFREKSFDVLISKAVFEHLAMPWKAVLEINKVLKENGLLFINSLQTFPLHERPWDFWRFSEEAWKVLLNRTTGFEIIFTNMEFPCKVVPKAEVQDWLIDHEAYLLSNVLARKIGDYDRSRFAWDITVKEILDTIYPKRPE